MLRGFSKSYKMIRPLCNLGSRLFSNLDNTQGGDYLGKIHTLLTRTAIQRAPALGSLCSVHVVCLSYFLLLPLRSHVFFYCCIFNCLQSMQSFCFTAPFWLLFTLADQDVIAFYLLAHRFPRAFT